MTTDLAYSLDVEIKRLRRHTISSFWKLIELLREARRMGIWEKMGYDTWGSYLAQSEISLKKSSVDNYITAFNRFEELQLPESEYSEIPRSKAVLISPHINEENVQELVGQARELSFSDLRTEIKLLNGEDEPEETGRPAKPRIKWCDVHQKWWIQDLHDVCTHL